jgi:hypothetical protein
MHLDTFLKDDHCACTDLGMTEDRGFAAYRSRVVHIMRIDLFGEPSTAAAFTEKLWLLN